MSKIVLKKSSVAGKMPIASDLDYGEIAINYADGVIYYKNADNTINSISSNRLTVTNTDFTNSTYYYYGGLTSSGWQINRYMISDVSTKLTAKQSNNTSVLNLTNAWSLRTSLVYA